MDEWALLDTYTALGDGILFGGGRCGDRTVFKCKDSALRFYRQALYWRVGYVDRRGDIRWLGPYDLERDGPESRNPGGNMSEYLSDWLAIGKRNRWIAGAVDPPFGLDSFCHCADVDQLVGRLQRDWVCGQAFYLGDLCFVNQVNGGSEYLVIRGSLAFDSLSAAVMSPERLKLWIARVREATDDALRNLEY